MEYNRASKINVELNDMLYLQNKLKTSARELGDEFVNQYFLEPLSKHQKNLFQQEMNEWIDSIFMDLGNNVVFTDADGIEGQALLGRSDPIDERLKSKVAAKEAEQNAYFNKVVTARTNLPVLLTGVAEELCKKQSDYAENFKLNPPSSPKEDEEEAFNINMEDIKEDYAASMRLLSKLREDTPSQIHEFDRLEEITKLLENL